MKELRKIKFPILIGEGEGKGIGGTSYKYVTMEEIERYIFPILEDNGIKVEQSVKVNVLDNIGIGKVSVTNNYIKESEHFDTTVYELPIQTSPGMSIQEQMAAEVTFLKRFSLIIDLDLKMTNDKKQPKQKKPLNPGTPDWTNAVAALKDDKTTIENLKELFNISETNIKILESL